MRKLLLALLVSGIAMAMSTSAAMAGGTSDTTCDAVFANKFPQTPFCFLKFLCTNEAGEEYFVIAMGCQGTTQKRGEMNRWFDALFEKYVVGFGKDDAQCADPPEVFGNFCP